MAKNRLRAQLANVGVDPPIGLWFGPGRAWLDDLDLPVMHRRVIVSPAWKPRPPLRPT
jgi:hypothetical protein